MKAIAPLTVRIELGAPGKENLLGLLSLPVMPKAYWKDHKLSDPLSRPPLASGPYKITAWKMGQYVVYSRVKDYWAANLPVNRGRWNFDSIRYDYYLDDNVAFEKSEAAKDTRWLAFNIQRPQFADRRVREAITLAFDFEWMNKALFYHAYSRPNSYFQNTEYAARDYPKADELVLLAPMKAELPPEVFTTIYQPPVSNLERLGITMNIRQVDNSQITNRLRTRDYDMMPTLWHAMPWPGTDLQISWASQYIDSSYNAPGVKSPVVDNLINQIMAHQGDKEKLLPLGRALDRVLTWNFYMLPMWYIPADRFAYWDKFSHPAIAPLYSLGFDTWWYDVNRAAKLPAGRR